MSGSGNNPLHCAVLVIDVQQALIGASPPPFEAESVLAIINEVTTKARSAGVPVFLVQHDGSAEDDLVPDTPGWQFHGGLQTSPHDVRIRKTTCDAFYRSGLEEELRRRGVTDLVIVGYATDFCVDSTVRAAASREFAVTVVADAHTTHDNPCCGASQVRAHANWAWANCTTSKPVRVVPGHELWLG
jgi:nicotinamidase-related amidase